MDDAAHPEDWSALLDAFAAYQHAICGLAPATVATHHTYLRAFAGWWQQARGEVPLASARTADLVEHLVAEAARGVAVGTRRGKTAALRRFFAWLALLGRIEHDPAAALELPRKPAPRPELYHPEEVTAILAHLATLADVRGRQRHALVASLRYTGMRSGELRRLHTADLDLAAARARVQTKAGRRRIVVLPPALVGILEAFLTDVRPELGPSPLLLVNPHPYVTTPDRGFSQQTLQREVELAGHGAGLAGPHFPHRWRHTFATELVRRGVNLYTIQRLLGHASLRTTLGYVHLGLDDLQATVAALWAEPPGTSPDEPPAASA